MKIIEQNGKIKKVTDQEAYKLVDIMKLATYKAKSVWKTLHPITKVKKGVIEDVEENSTVKPIVKEKAKKEKKKEKKQ